MVRVVRKEMVRMAVRESHIEKWLSGAMAKAGVLSYKWVSPGCSGVPDRIYIGRGGRVVFAELKTDSGRLSPLQKYQIEKLRKQGCEVRVVRGMEEAKQLVEEMRDGGVSST